MICLNFFLYFWTNIENYPTVSGYDEWRSTKGRRTNFYYWQGTCRGYLFMQQFIIWAKMKLNFLSSPLTHGKTSHQSPLNCYMWVAIEIPFLLFGCCIENPFLIGSFYHRLPWRDHMIGVLFLFRWTIRSRQQRTWQGWSVRSQVAPLWPPSGVQPAPRTRAATSPRVVAPPQVRCGVVPALNLCNGDVPHLKCQIRELERELESIIAGVCNALIRAHTFWVVELVNGLRMKEILAPRRVPMHDLVWPLARMRTLWRTKRPLSRWEGWSGGRALLLGCVPVVLWALRLLLRLSSLVVSPPSFAPAWVGPGLLNCGGGVLVFTFGGNGLQVVLLIPPTLVLVGEFVVNTFDGSRCLSQYTLCP